MLRSDRDVAEYLAMLARLPEAAITADIITFRVSVPATGGITQATPERLREDVRYLLTEVRAGCTIDTTSAATLEDLDQIRFNIRRSDTKNNLFTNDVEISSMVAPQSGCPLPITFGAGTLITAGTTLTPTFTRRGTMDTARVVAVELVFQLIPAAKK